MLEAPKSSSTLIRLNSIALVVAVAFHQTTEECGQPKAKQERNSLSLRTNRNSWVAPANTWCTSVWRDVSSRKQSLVVKDENAALSQ